MNYAGEDQTVYAWIDGFDDVTLDGSDSKNRGRLPIFGCSTNLAKITMDSHLFFSVTFHFQTTLPKTAISVKEKPHS